MQSNGRDSTGRWSSKSIGSRFQHGVFYCLIRMRAGWIIFALLRLVVLYYVVFRPSIRRRGDQYLARRFPGIGGLRKLRYTYLHDLSLGETLVERAILGIIGPRAVTVDFRERERLKKLVLEKKGLVLMTAHVGGWQVAMSALRFLDLPINLLLHRDAGDVDRHYFEHNRTEGAPLRIIDPLEELGGMLTMIEVLKKGEVLCVMGDRTFGSLKNTVEVPFLGDPIRLPFSAFKIASATGSPVAIMFSFRTGPGEYHLTLDKLIRVPANLGRSGKEYDPFVMEFVRAMESFVEKHPFQFFNFYDMWQKD